MDKSPAENRQAQGTDHELLQWRALEIVFGQNNNATSGGLICLGVAAVAFWSQVPDWVWLGWIVIYGGLVFYRSRIIARYNRNKPHQPEPLKTWQTRMDLIQFSTGALWGGLLAYLAYIGFPRQVIVVTLIMTGLLTGGLLVFSFRQKTYMLFSSSLCIPPVLGMLMREDPLLLGGFVGGTTFFFLVACSRRFGEFYNQSVKLYLVNKNLAADLEQRNQEVSDLNRSLHKKVAELGKSNSNLLSEQERIAAFASQLERLSTTDPLTHIANRRHFETSLDKAWARALRGGHEVALVMVDVDHFKAFNDNYGHQQGDECLVTVAQILAAHARPEDCVARYGGEEFVVLMPHSTHFEALESARHLVQRVADAGIDHHHSPVADHVTISAGLSITRPCPASCPQALIENADQALYNAKKSGRNQVISDRADGVLESASRPVVQLDDVWRSPAANSDDRPRQQARR